MNHDLIDPSLCKCNTLMKVQQTCRKSNAYHEYVTLDRLDITFGTIENLILKNPISQKINTISDVINSFFKDF